MIKEKNDSERMKLVDSDRNLLSRILEGIFIAVVAGLILFFIKSCIKGNGIKDSSPTDSRSSPDPTYESPESIRQKNLHTGDEFSYGRFEQDNDQSNGSEPIDWIVLTTKGNKALVISKYGLERKAFQEKSSNATWSNSSLRSWLNDDFFLDAFDENERTWIALTTVEPAKNPNHQEIDAGERTMDRIFLLSANEAETYMPKNSDKQCKATVHLEKQNALVREGYCWWWLRNPGDTPDRAIGVTTYGVVIYDGVDDMGSVRPAMWIEFS